ncbi:MAG TPA: hypothetical protein VKQ09_05610 [Sphingomonas sp.]|nr:hypothetical protein [Sphingomonas sp.]
MSEPSAPRAGGVLLALSILAGAVIGTARGEPTVGVLVGIGAGITLTLGLWWVEHRRDRP